MSLTKFVQEKDVKERFRQEYLPQSYRELADKSSWYGDLRRTYCKRTENFWMKVLGPATSDATYHAWP